MSVKIARIKKGMTQEQLRKAVGISPRKIVAVEKGDFSTLTFANMKAISEALEVSVQELFFSEE